MLRRRNRWFTIVATDMFSGAFAAIVLLDAISPKEVGNEPSTQELSMTFQSQSGNCPTDTGAVVLRFEEGGDIKNTLENQFKFSNIQQTGQSCIFSGPVEVYTNEISNVCFLIAELIGPDLTFVEVEVTGANSVGRVGHC